MAPSLDRLDNERPKPFVRRSSRYLAEKQVETKNRLKKKKKTVILALGRTQFHSRFFFFSLCYYGKSHHACHMKPLLVMIFLPTKGVWNYSRAHIYNCLVASTFSDSLNQLHSLHYYSFGVKSLEDLKKKTNGFFTTLSCAQHHPLNRAVKFLPERSQWRDDPLAHLLRSTMAP